LIAESVGMDLQTSSPSFSMPGNAAVLTLFGVSAADDGDGPGYARER